MNKDSLQPEAVQAQQETAYDQHHSFTDLAARLVAGVFVLFLLAIGVRFLTLNILIEHLHMNNAFTQAVMFDQPALLERADENYTAIEEAAPVYVDWEQQYPFAEEREAAEITPAAAPSPLSAITSRLKSAVEGIKEKLDSYTTHMLMFHDKAVELGNYYEALLGWEIPDINNRNNVVTLSDGYLSQVYPKADTRQYAANASELDRLLAQQGMPFLYLQTPFKINADDTDIDGILDFSNQNADDLLSQLTALGVDTYDLRQVLRSTGVDYHSYFFRTDHHWKPEIGLWVAGVLGEYLNQNYGLTVDTTLYQEDLYTYQLYHDGFLGSQGQKVTSARAQSEDISLIFPNFATDISIQIPSLAVDKRGDFSVFYQFNESQTIYYTTYLYGDQALTRIENHLRPEGNKLLILGDSFDNCLIPFLALGVHQIDSIDLRSFTGSLQSYLSQNTYDLVIMDNNPGMIAEDALWDFR